jgi:hypothetical protein
MLPQVPRSDSMDVDRQKSCTVSFGTEEEVDAWVRERYNSNLTPPIERQYLEVEYWGYGDLADEVRDDIAAAEEGEDGPTLLYLIGSCTRRGAPMALIKYLETSPAETLIPETAGRPARRQTTATMAMRTILVNNPAKLDGWLAGLRLEVFKPASQTVSKSRINPASCKP